MKCNQQLILFIISDERNYAVNSGNTSLSVCVRTVEKLEHFALVYIFALLNAVHLPEEILGADLNLFIWNLCRFITYY